MNSFGALSHVFLKVEIIFDKHYKRGLITLQTETLLTQVHLRQKNDEAEIIFALINCINKKLRVYSFSNVNKK